MNQVHLLGFPLDLTGMTLPPSTVPTGPFHFSPILCKIEVRKHRNVNDKERTYTKGRTQ